MPQPKNKSRIIEDGKTWELVAYKAEDISEAKQEAVDKLDVLIDRKYKKLNHEVDDVDDMIDEISELSKN